MAKKNIKIKATEKKRAEKRIAELIKRILEKTPRSTATYKGKRTITPNSYDLFNNIKPTITLNNSVLNVDVRMMEYYKYLDAGTVHIKPWFFTEEIMDDPELLDIMNDLVFDSVDERLIDMISNIEKKK